MSWKRVTAMGRDGCFRQVEMQGGKSRFTTRSLTGDGLGQGQLGRRRTQVRRLGCLGHSHR
jgi:hypothetical protein